MTKVYLKVKKDICPECGGLREIVVEGFSYRKGRVERPYRIAGFKCGRCSYSKPAELLRKGLTKTLI